MPQTVLQPTCRMCRKEYQLNVKTEDVEKLNRGEHIQHAMPYLSPGDRELLISGICDTCFNNMFSEEEEE